MTESQSVNKKDLVYHLEGKPSIWVAFPLGMQHVLAMFAANLAPILIIAGICSLSGGDTVLMVQSAMFVSGLATLLQLYPLKIGKIQIGGNLPIVMGTSFTFVPTATSVAAMGGIPAVLGCSLAGSLGLVMIGIYYKYLRKFFPPLVIGCTLVAVGVKLIGVGVDYFAGGFGAADYGSVKNMAVAFVVFTLIICLQRFGKGLVKNSSLLIGLIIGYLLAISLHMVNFSNLGEIGWFMIPLPLKFGLKFPWQGILLFFILYIEAGLETIGNTTGVTIAGLDREATDREISGSILAGAVGSAAAAVFNALPNTAFGQNVGIIAMTKIVNKWCIAVGAMVLMVCAFLPKLGAVFSTIPNCVLGGAVISVFGIILVNGIKMIALAGFSERNVMVMAVTFALGIGVAGQPAAVAQLPVVLKFLFSDAVAATCIVAILVNILFPQEKETGG